MKKTPLGGICLSLGLLQPDDVERILEVQALGEPARFGEVGIRLGRLVESAVARALARQFGLNVIPDERLDRLSIPEGSLDLLPRRLIRQRLVLPVFFMRETRTLTLLTADPSDRYTIRVAQAAARAREVRLFVATPSALARAIARLPSNPTEALEPEADPTLLGPLVVPAHFSTPTLVLEPDPERWRLLRELDAAENGCTSFVADPEHVEGLLEKTDFGRLFYREEISDWVAPHKARWLKARPTLSLCPLVGYGPGVWPTLNPETAQRSLVDLITWIAVASEPLNAESRHTLRLGIGLLRGCGARLSLAETDLDTLILAFLLIRMEQLTFLKELVRDFGESAGPQGLPSTQRFRAARALLAVFAPPHPIARLLDELEHRLNGGGPVGNHAGAEILYTLKALLRRMGPGTTDLRDLLGDDLAHHHAPVVEALGAELLARIQRMESLSGTPQPAEVLLALSDMPLLTALELRFFMAGFRVSIATDGQEALTLARCLRPVCLVADWRLPRLEGVALLAALHEHPDSRELPVILLLSTPPGPISTRAMDLGAEDVLHKPFPPDLLVAKVRRIAARRPPRAAEGIRGRLRDLPAHDLLQVFVLGGRTAVVRLDTDSERGEIWIDRGRLVAAKLGAIDGLDALKAMIALPDGRFHVEPEVPPPKANLVGTSEWLLLEAMRHRDEARSAK